MNSQMIANRKKVLLFSLIILVVIGLILHLLMVTTRLWWDEGWTVAVAKNWIESGYYGQIMNDELLPPGLSAHFPVVALVALSFKLFGVGIWQARLPLASLTLASLLALFYLASILYNRKMAFGSLLILGLLSLSYHLHPFIIGCQVMGEPAMIFFLLLGYVFLWWALSDKWWLIFPAGLLWGIALATKSQVQPFWLASILLPSLIALYKKWWRATYLLAIGALTTFVVFKWLLPGIQNLIIADIYVPGEPLIGAFQVLGFLLDWPFRLGALIVVCIKGGWMVLGLFYVSWNSIRNLMQPENDFRIETLRWTLIGLVASWFAWFLFFSMPWDRYLYPAYFVGSIFASSFLFTVTYGFDFKKTYNKAKEIMPSRKKPLNKRDWLVSCKSFIILLFLTMNVYLSLFVLYSNIISFQDEAYHQVINYINLETPQSALVDTYEGELFLLMERDYHFPPDQISLEMIRMHKLGQDIQIEYDLLNANPDYLVVGSFGNMWELYKPWIDSGEYELIKDYSSYKIFIRADE